MKCPSCAHEIATPEPRCPHCRLTIARLDTKFGILPAHSRYLTDRTGQLALDEMNALRAALRLFHKKFPQIIFSIFVNELPPGSSVSEYAFWIANRAHFSSGDKTGNDNFNLLLMIDLTGHTAALTVGYGLEPYVSEQDLKSILDDFANTWRNGDLAAALRTVIDSATRRLRELVLENTKAQKLQHATA